MTRKELVQALSVLDFSISLTSIGNYERGERAPDFEDLWQIATALEEDHFEVYDNLRVDFSPNGRLRPEALPQQLDLVFDGNDGVTVRIESAKHGVVIKKIPA